MRRELLIVTLAACHATDADPEGSIEQAVVLAAPNPVELVDLAHCVEVPDPLTVDWIKQRLTYHRSCFSSWSVRVPIECPLGDRFVTGSVVVAGDAMARLPETGLLIRARAASAALVDLATLASGELVRPRIELEVGTDGLSLAGCAAPVAGGVHGDLEMVADIPSLGTTTIGGAAELARIDDTWTVGFDFSIAAEPAEGPRVAGELVGVGISRADNSNPCPDSGEIRFVGSIGDTASEAHLSYEGDDRVVISLPDDTQIGPFVPSSCVR